MDLTGRTRPDEPDTIAGNIFMKNRPILTDFHLEQQPLLEINDHLKYSIQIFFKKVVSD